MALLRSLSRQFKALAVAQPRIAAPVAGTALRTFPGLAQALPTRTLLNPFASTMMGMTESLFPQMQVRCKGYKLKTKSAVKKRFKVNCNGLVKRSQANKRHIATKKSRERLRRLGKSVLVQGKIRKNILRMLNN